MWSDRKPWWAKKAEENKVDKTHYKDWCVIEVYKARAVVGSGLWLVKEYKACAKLNAPVRFDLDGKTIQKIVVDKLTKQEAHEVAKGLNFLDGGECEQ
jgi:hypothetical protein